MAYILNKGHMFLFISMHIFNILDDIRKIPGKIYLWGGTDKIRLGKVSRRNSSFIQNALLNFLFKHT